MLNRMGHNLELAYPSRPGEISYRDQKNSEEGYQCELRIAFDRVVSTGYAHLINLDESNDQIPN